MDLRNKTCNSDDTLYNSRLIRNYVEYTSKYHPDADIDKVLEYSSIARHELEDPGHWFNQQQVDRFHESLVKETGHTAISRDVGRYAAFSQTSSTIRQYALGFLSPAFVYKMLERFAANLTQASKIKTRKISNNAVDVRITLKPGVVEKQYQCENRIGLLESIARVFSDSFPNIEHPKCIHKGDSCCHYIISWKKTPASVWNRIRNYFLLFAVISTLVLCFLISPGQWLLYLLICAVVASGFSSYSAYLEKKELTQTIQTQGDAAKELINEMNMRYNNALLIQEIGHASSGMRNTDLLCQTIVNLMEKHLDFDRGMIMLASEDKKRLVHVAGYGYAAEQEALLDKIEFHLDNHESKGMFVRAFKDRKPFLVNDLVKEKNKL